MTDSSTTATPKRNKLLAHVTITLDDGSVADSTRVSEKPNWLILGRGDFSEAFESEVASLQAGDKHKFKLNAEDAFGELNNNLIQFMDITQFPQDLALEEGAIVSFANPAGGEMPGIIRSVMADSVKVDFNHPLAGKAVTFEVEVLRTADEHAAESVQ